MSRLLSIDDLDREYDVDEIVVQDDPIGEEFFAIERRRMFRYFRTAEPVDAIDLAEEMFAADNIMVYDEY